MRISVSLALTVAAIGVTTTHAEIPKEMTSLMNPNVDPCIDFYEFACGGWVKSNEVHPLKPVSVSSYMQLEARNEKIFKQIIKRKYPLLDEMWESCMSLEEKPIDDVLQKDLNRIINAHTKVQLLLLAGEFSRTGTNAFIKFHIESKPINKGFRYRYNGIVVRPSESTLPEGFNHGPGFRVIKKHYKEYIGNLLMLSGYPFPSEDRRQIAINHILQLEEKLASIHSEKESGEMKEFNYVDVTAKWPLTFGAFSQGLGAVGNLKWKEHDLFYVDHVHYLESVESLLKSFSLDDLKVYVAFLMIHSRAQWMGTIYYDTWFKFFGEEIKGERQPSRSKVCTNQLIEFLPDEFGKYFSDAVDKRQILKREVTYISALLQNAFEKRIEDSTWMDPKTEENTKLKLNKMTRLIGNQRALHSYDINLSRTHYALNVHTILSTRFAAEFGKVKQRLDKLSSLESAAIPNVKYIAHTNTIQVSTAMLQPPFYNVLKAHPARNFGGIGTMIAREMIHSVDNIGHQYNENGFKFNWWNELTTKVYETRGKCMIRQYSRFEVVGENGRQLGNVNGRKTLDENIADVGGLAIAWDAYRKHVVENNFEIVHHNKKSEQDGDQMFFLAFGQNWCTKAGNGALSTIVATDDFAPAKWRVNGAVMNNPNFAKVFQCKRTVRMNPNEKCLLW